MKGKNYSWLNVMGRDRWIALARAVGVMSVYGLLYFSVGLPVGVGYFLYARLIRNDELREATLHMEDALLYLHAIAMVLILLVLAGVIQLILHRINRSYTFREIGIRSNKRTWLWALLSFLLASFLVVIIFLVGRSIGLVHILEPTQEETLWKDIIIDLIGSVVLFAAIAVTEELVFRGFMPFNLTPAFSPRMALVISAVLYAFSITVIVHWSVLSALNAMLTGLILGMLFLATGSLWVPILAHFGWIFTASFIFSFPTAGFFSEGLILTRIEHGLLMGKYKSPGDGLFAFGLLLLTAIGLWLFTKKRLGVNTGEARI